MGLFTRVVDDSPVADLTTEKQHDEYDVAILTTKAKNQLEKDLEHAPAVSLIPSQLDNIVKANNDARSHLKAKLKSLLEKYNGCTKHSEVVDVVNELTKLNPITKTCAQHALFAGEYYTLTAPTFPGRIKPTNTDQEDIVQYTLGRISFNIFQPNKLICTLRSVRNPVQPRKELTKDGRKKL
jgi:hypothetical protein